jgi:integrase
MSLSQVKPNRFVVQISRADPLRETSLRLCKRVEGREAAEAQEREFERQAEDWVARRELIRQARATGLSVELPSTPSKQQDFPSYLESAYIPWAKTHLDPKTFSTRAGYLAILAQDLAGVPIDGIERVVDEMVARWRAEGCRYVATVDKLGRTLNRKPRAISDAGINERLKILRAVLGHAFLNAKVLPARQRIPLVRKKRAEPGAAEPVRYFSFEERVRFLRYARSDMADVFQLEILTGMRPGEAFHLRVGSVDLRNRKILVQAGPCPNCPDGKWIPKTGEYRAIDIADALLPIVRRMIKGKRDDDFVISNNHGRPYSRLDGGNGQFAKTLRRAGLDRQGLSFYSLRHSFAADLITAGRPIQEVAALLGNSPRTCELHYAHLMPGRTREAVKVLRAAEPWGAPADAKRSKRAAPLPARPPETVRTDAASPSFDDIEAA